MSLGISAFYHDSAAALLRNGEIVAAASDERFSRIKGDAGFPAQVVADCLRTAGITTHDLAAVGFYDKPLLKFERILESYVGIAHADFARSSRLDRCLLSSHAGADTRSALLPSPSR
jgi:carbamoyltransferase